MSTKTVALELSIYERLASQKREGESFSKVIDRLLSEASSSHTGRQILQGLEAVPPLPDEEAARFLEIIEENRNSEEWDRE